MDRSLLSVVANNPMQGLENKAAIVVGGFCLQTR
jgi:hypothetical protein